MKRFLSGAVAVDFASAGLLTASVHVNVAGRDVAVWKPDRASARGGISRSHLFARLLGDCNTQSVFLMEALAKAGYLMVAPNHADAQLRRCP